jgi:ABC-type branched-subunit amino acid transport system substrate-binding protein/small-conductance mechanosensitive channel
MNALDRLRAHLSHLSKRGLFLSILAGAGGIAALLSIVVWVAVLDTSSKKPVRIAVLAPASGRSTEQGESIRRGVDLLVQQVNKSGGIGGHPLAVVQIDDGDDPALAKEAAEKAAASDVIGVIGHASGAAARAASEVYAARGIPALTPATAQQEALPADPWLFRTTFDETFETRFLANYVRNVVGEKTVSIIHSGSPRDETLSTVFDEVLQRFGTKVLFRWTYNPASTSLDRDIEKVAIDIGDKKLIGAVFVLGDADAAGRIVASLRKNGVRNKVVGLRALATDAFRSSLAAHWKGEGSVGAALNGTMVSAPMLLDTAGERAQRFRNAFIETYAIQPDWLAGYAFDGARLLAETYRGLSAAQRTGPSLRILLRDALAAMNRVDKAFAGINGPQFFDARGVSAAPAWIGQYDGIELVSALTQLSPIREEGVANYLQELIAGRALYVNDRFMYKTNVVFAGVKVDKVSALDTKANTVDLDFTIWFRWRGGIDPQDVVFTNAVTPIKLDKPEKEGQDGDMLYRSYRVHGKFFRNYSQVSRAYGTELVGLSFHHRLLNGNNLMYVSDVLGMELGSGGTLQEQLRKSKMSISEGDGGGLLKSVLGTLSGGMVNADPLVDMMTRGRVLAGLSGWMIERAWVSQEAALRGTGGDPTFVGFGKPLPSFSTIDMGMILKPDGFKARDAFPADSFIYIAIFSLAGSVVASLLDRKERGQFWRMQTLVLRAISWPLLLVSVGNLFLDYALQNFSTSAIDAIFFVYETLWWMVPARIITISLERFLWVPIESRSGRKVPNVIRMLSSAVVYSLAVCGVVAFVMGQTLTSLLATSGVLAMIIGLAVQANIANIFSGVVLNIERPFKVGDFVKIGNITGQIKDITWRTVRIRSNGYTVSLANGKVSEAEVHNYSTAKGAYTGLIIHADPTHDPDQVVALIKHSLVGVKEFIAGEDPEGGGSTEGAEVHFAGVECIGGHWVARYNIRFSIKHMGRMRFAQDEVWTRIWQAFAEAGIVWKPLSEDTREPVDIPVPVRA